MRRFFRPTWAEIDLDAVIADRGLRSRDVTISADTLHTAEFVTLFEFGPDAHADATHLHEAWTWDLGKGAWVFDHHA